MNTTALFILSILDIIAELTQLSYELGVFTRKYIVPVLVAIFVAGEIVWDKLTSIEIDLNIRRTPLTTGLSFS